MQRGCGVCILGEGGYDQAWISRGTRNKRAMNKWAMTWRCLKNPNHPAWSPFRGTLLSADKESPNIS